MGDLNNSGNFVGVIFEGTEAVIQEQPFASIGGVATLLPIADGFASGEADSINNSGTTIVGTTGDSPSSGFIYQTATQNLDVKQYPNAASTAMVGVNNSGTITGDWMDAAYGWHGFALIGDTWINYDYPGATQTQLAHINDHDVAVGYYTIAGFTHGLLVQINQ